MVEIRPVESDEIPEAIELVRSVFAEFVRPDLEPGGWEKILEYVDADAAVARVGDHVTIVAVEGSAIVGVIEIRLAKHVSLLVVEKEYFGKGIARRLLEHGVSVCREAKPDLECLTVNASRYAIDAYRRLGFVVAAEETVLDGIRFTPMVLALR